MSDFVPGFDTEPPPNPGVETKHKAKKPWWNDEDKMGAIGATVMTISILIVVLALAIGLSYKILGWFGVIG